MTKKIKIGMYKVSKVKRTETDKGAGVKESYTYTLDGDDGRVIAIISEDRVEDLKQGEYGLEVIISNPQTRLDE